MKNSIIFIIFLSFFTALLNPLFSNSNNNPVISEKEKESLIHMRSEEKLAHDIYVALYEKWDLNIFYNISKSEKRHIETIQSLLDQYAIEAPEMLGTGKFVNPKFQKLYDDLLSQGSVSIEQALKTGLLIEDLDISDLEKLIDETKIEDLKIVYTNLNLASARHLRSFYSRLNDPSEYSPTYLTKERFDSIIEDTHTKGKNKGRIAKGNKGKGSCSAKNQKGCFNSKGNNSGRNCKGSAAVGRKSRRR